MFSYTSLSLILKISLRIPLRAFGLLKTTTFTKIPPKLPCHFWQEIIPRMTSMTARMKIIILTGRHIASSRPAPKAVKTSPFGQLRCCDTKNHPLCISVDTAFSVISNIIR